MYIVSALRVDILVGEMVMAMESMVICVMLEVLHVV